MGYELLSGMGLLAASVVAATSVPKAVRFFRLCRVAYRRLRRERSGKGAGDVR